MLFQKGFDVLGERSVVVDIVVGGIAVVSGVDGVDGSFEDACDCTGSELVLSTNESVE